MVLLMLIAISRGWPRISGPCSVADQSLAFEHDIRGRTAYDFIMVCGLLPKMVNWRKAYMQLL
jgi:hypothetical protein